MSRQMLVECSYYRGCDDGGGGENLGRMGITEMQTGLWKEKSVRKGQLGRPRQKWIGS